MLWYMDNFTFILIFVYFRCVVLCLLSNITVSTVHLKFLITAVCANIPAKTASSSSFKNLFVNSVDYFVPPPCLVESHYTLSCFQYTLSIATEGQGVCLLLQWVLVGRTKS